MVMNYNSCCVFAIKTRFREPSVYNVIDGVTIAISETIHLQRKSENAICLRRIHHISYELVISIIFK